MGRGVGRLREGGEESGEKEGGGRGGGGGEAAGALTLLARAGVGHTYPP